MKKPGAGGDMTLESRHLVGLFLGVVVLCCVFFSLGYVMGNSQDASARVMAAANDVKPSAPAEPAARSGPSEPAVPTPSEWRFPSAAEPAEPAEKIEPSKPTVELNPPAGSSTPAVSRPPAIGSAPATVSKPSASTTAAAKSKTAAPRIAKGSILLQVAALTRESDALLLAEALQRKNFPAFLTTPGADKYYRVQVGPYADKESADLAKRALEREGFKAIVKR
jgi:cell division septation protein DedD